MENVIIFGQICLFVAVHLTIVSYLLQDEVDSQNPVLRDNHQLHEEIKCWLKGQKVQEIFMQGESAPATSRQRCNGPFHGFADVRRS